MQQAISTLGLCPISPPLHLCTQHKPLPGHCDDDDDDDRGHVDEPYKDGENDNANGNNDDDDNFHDYNEDDANDGF